MLAIKQKSVILLWCNLQKLNQETNVMKDLHYS